MLTVPGVTLPMAVVDPVSPLAAPLTPAVIDAGIAATRRPGKDSGSILRPP